jgi:3'(2'), 5'-bisphosphate nucleotidase
MQEKIRELAEAAGREIMKIYLSGNWTVTEKEDSSPVTQADLAANAILVPGLSRLTTEPIVSEESDPQSVKVGRQFWLIDPLDGTRDFINRNDTFVVCIARVEDGYPSFGLIHAPVTGETWWAEKGRGAYAADGRKLSHTFRRDPLIAIGSRSMPSDRMQMFYNYFRIQEVRRIGSAMKFCRLAEGDVDLYPRFGPTSEWDTAAGQIIAEEAGCKVIDIFTGERLRYGKPGFENSGGFMASRADLDLVAPLKASGLIKN